MPTNRRDFLKSTILASTLPGCGWPEGSKAAEPVVEIDIAGYPQVLLPREHGQLTSTAKSLLRRYPSRDHCMQMAAFFGKDKGLLVYTKDSDANVSDWEIVPGRALRIRFYGAVPQIVTEEIEPTIAAAAAGYRKWALFQPWITRRQRSSPKLSVISVASNPDTQGQREHLRRFFSSMPRPVGAWFTQYRRYGFDEMYPDYVPRDASGFSRLLRDLREDSCITFPYVNGMLWDSRLTSFSLLGDRVALRNSRKERVSYNSDMPYLIHACPFVEDWQEVIVDARESLKDDHGQPSAGVYLDMLLASAPYLCWSKSHGHAEGDPLAWQAGIRSLLEQIAGLVLTEGCAEPYLDLADYVLMHLHSQEKDAVPLWSLVYGSSVQSVGWSLRKGLDDRSLATELSRAESFGVNAAGTPWMTSDPESKLFTPEVQRLIRAAVAGKNLDI